MVITINKKNDCYLVTFPDYVTLACLIEWGDKFSSKLDGELHQRLLLDSKLHRFESIDCLKWLRAFINELCVVNNSIDTVAFVQPSNYREPEIVSANEAYFSKLADAQKWLNI